eukprot:TRINITY_DN21916_c0_g1_i1.p1 TRINITY_DN21916_c0_g1~~TRINITY_DN21916_c0_g1_i1.p1  ORF type:complete len:866 (-),score=121.74 TRINITY_DN21916_c0_g1_i1:242-2818(-)
MYSYRVNSTVIHRYSITKVKSIVINPAGVTRVYRFGIVIPKTAFVSNVTLERGDMVLKSTPEPSWDSLHPTSDHDAEDKAHSNGRKKHGPNHRLFHSLRKQQDKFNSDFSDFQQFILPINLRPNENVTITLVYEDLLRRRFDRLSHSLSVNPGSIVEDFQLRLSIKENRPLIHLKVNAPVIGDMASFQLGNASSNDGSVEYFFNMSKVEQFDYFGNHGVTGEFRAEYDVEPVKGDVPDVIIQDDTFVHFYDRTKGLTGSIPKHVIFMLDVSESMSGPKMAHALKSIGLLLDDLDKGDYVNLLTFNSSVYEWDHQSVDGNETFRCDNSTRYSIRTYLNNTVVPSGKSDILSAVSRGMELDQMLWLSGSLPENAHTLFVMITDGRAPSNHSEARYIRRRIRKLNNLSQIPILILGMGFDANMDFLENIAEKSNGFAENIVEDLEVEPQLTRIRTYFKDVILKNLLLNYINPHAFDKSSLTTSKFKYFHKGGGIVVVGKFLPSSTYKPEFEVEITGQSARGLYMEHPYTMDLFTPCCEGRIRLCSEKHLKGSCITVDNSRANLIQYSFGNKAVSLRIEGNCTWTIYDEAYYSGRNITFAPGTYDIEAIQRHVSSLKRNCITQPESVFEYETENTDSIVSRLWAFLTIKDVLSALSERPERLSLSRMNEASELSYKYHFLSPFIDLRLRAKGLRRDEVGEDDNLVEPNSETFIDNDLLTYNDLSPILSSLKDPAIVRQWQSLESCQPPVKCIGNFHIEQLEGRKRNDTLPDSCGGSLTLFTKPGFEGDSHEIRYSVFQIYHRVSSQRFRSLFTEGRCCWLLFNKRFFAGNVEKICGDSRNPLRMKNIGSIKLIRPSSSIIKK